MEGRQLSSNATFFIKCILPPVCLMALIAWTAGAWWAGAPVFLRVFGLVLLVFGAVCIPRYLLPLKHVTAREEGLEVYNYVNTVLVPYDDVARVREYWPGLRWPHDVVIYLSPDISRNSSR